MQGDGVTVCLCAGALVANKVDLSGRREVGEEEGSKLADSKELAYFETSAVSATPPLSHTHSLTAALHRRNTAVLRSHFSTWLSNSTSSTVRATVASQLTPNSLTPSHCHALTPSPSHHTHNQLKIIH